MIITKQFLEDNRTPKGSFTKQQLKCLGVKWPPKSGWMKRVEGQEISDSDKQSFINGRFQIGGNKGHKERIEKLESKVEHLTECMKGVELLIERIGL